MSQPALTLACWAQTIPRIWSFAQREGRVVFTNDADFLALAAEDSNHAGIAYCQPGARTIGHIVRHLVLMSDYLDQEEMHGKVEFL